MKMESINRNAIKIVLTKSDLGRFGLDYEKLSCENIQTRELIHALLETASKDFGFERRGKQLSIRTLPLKDGCVMYMSIVSGNEKAVLRRDNGPFLFGFSDADTLLDALEALCFSGYDKRFRSNLYKSDNGYILAVIASRELPCGMLHILSEFAEYTEKGTVQFARVAERCKLLAENNAIRIALGK